MEINNMNTNRASSLDVLRGYAIITMVLSGTIAFGVLPGWMHHAQTPPPSHAFNPQNFGITWVDLVFPFFLFAMGAAFPFSLGRKIEKGVSKLLLVKDSVLRGLQLVFFAIFIQHLYPWVLSSPQTPQAWGLSLLAFALMFPMFMRLPLKMPEWGHHAIKLGAFAVGFLLLNTLDYANDRTFSPGFSNIIILVLANMAVFGSLAYIFTFQKPLWRLSILPFVMAVFLGSATEGSWVGALFNWSPLPWMYKFYYLKYLFIVIPGSIAGEYLYQWLKSPRVDVPHRHGQLFAMVGLSIALIVGNLYCLYMRYLLANLVLSSILVTGLFFVVRNNGANGQLWRKLLVAGSYLLLLGLFFEAFEGGIRKDQSTYSYYFVTSGLAFFALMVFSVLCDIFQFKGGFRIIEMAGQNPMIAYVASSLVVLPILNLLDLSQFLDCLNGNPWLGFLRGVIVTSMAVALASFFTRIKWFWRT